MLRFQSFGNFQGYEGLWGYDRNLLKNFYFGWLSWTWEWSFIIIFKMHMWTILSWKNPPRGTYSRSISELTENINPGRGVRLLVWIMARNRGRWPSRAAANVNLRKNNWKRLSQIQENSYERMSLGFFCFLWHGAPQVRSLDIVIFSKYEWNCCIKCCCLFLLSKNPVFVFLPRSWTDFPWPFFYSTYLHRELMIIRECSLCRNSDKNWQN